MNTFDFQPKGPLSVRTGINFDQHNGDSVWVCLTDFIGEGQVCVYGQTSATLKRLSDQFAAAAETARRHEAALEAAGIAQPQTALVQPAVAGMDGF